MVQFLRLFPPTGSQVALGAAFYHTELKQQGWLVHAGSLTGLCLKTPGDLSELQRLIFQSNLHGLPCLLESESTAPLRFNAEMGAFEVNSNGPHVSTWQVLIDREAPSFDRRRFDIMRNENSYQPAYIDLVRDTVAKVLAGGSALMANKPEAVGLIHGGKNVCSYYGLTQAYQLLCQSLALAKDLQAIQACEFAHAAARCLWKSFLYQVNQLDAITQEHTSRANL